MQAEETVKLYFTIRSPGEKPTSFAADWESPTADIDLTLDADFWGTTYVDIRPGGRSEVMIEGDQVNEETA